MDESDNGRIISTDDTVNKWIDVNGSDDTEVTGTLPDVDKSDESTVKWARWNFKKAKTEILLYTIVGAGHTWPDGPQFLPVATIGEVDRDFDGTTAIWDFFQKHPKPWGGWGLTGGSMSAGWVRLLINCPASPHT